MSTVAESTVAEHYAKHLGSIYLWMAGGPEVALQAGGAEEEARVQRLRVAAFRALHDDVSGGGYSAQEQSGHR